MNFYDNKKRYNLESHMNLINSELMKIFFYPYHSMQITL